MEEKPKAYTTEVDPQKNQSKLKRKKSPKWELSTDLDLKNPDDRKKLATTLKKAAEYLTKSQDF